MDTIKDVEEFKKAVLLILPKTNPKFVEKLEWVFECARREAGMRELVAESERLGLYK